MPPVEGGGRSHAGGPPPIVGSADATKSYHTETAKADPDLTLSRSDVNDPASAPGSQGAVAMDGLPPRYEKLGEVGRGGMGKVVWCRDIELGRDLAVKVLRPEHYNNADITRRFVAEARIVGQLQHPGITPVHEVGYTAGGWPYFTMKLVRGRTLGALLRDRPSSMSSPKSSPRRAIFFSRVLFLLLQAYLPRVDPTSGFPGSPLAVRRGTRRSSSLASPVTLCSHSPSRSLRCLSSFRAGGFVRCATSSGRYNLLSVLIIFI